MDNWDELRTAYQVARQGTVSGAAEVLGVHHATVIRHIDALESQLGIKLFQRHPRGYTATEAGLDLMSVAEEADTRFAQLAGRLKGATEDVSGELVVTSLSSFANTVVPMLSGFRAAHPGVMMRFLTADRIFRLEYGEAHVAIRAGSAPEQPDNVVQPFFRDRVALYASQGYIDRNGRPETEDALQAHDFVAHDDDQSRAPFFQWLRAHVPQERIVFRTTDMAALELAVIAGVGLGFLPERRAAEIPDLHQVLPPRDAWAAPVWLVTHVDLHRTPKVQALLSHLKAEVRAWGD